MADKQVVISVGGAVVPIDRVANELSVSPQRLTDAALAAGKSDTKGVSDFYREWLARTFHKHPKQQPRNFLG